MKPLTFSIGNTWTVAVPTCRSIIDAVAEKHGFKREDLVGRDRSKLVSRARHEAIWRCRQVLRPDGSPRYSLTHIGNIFGGRDHTTCRNSILRWTEIMNGSGPYSQPPADRRMAALERKLAWRAATRHPVAIAAE